MRAINQRASDARRQRIYRYRKALESGKPMFIKQEHLGADVIALYEHYGFDATRYVMSTGISSSKDLYKEGKERKGYHRDYYYVRNNRPIPEQPEVSETQELISQRERLEDWLESGGKHLPAIKRMDTTGKGIISDNIDTGLDEIPYIRNADNLD